MARQCDPLFLSTSLLTKTRTLSTNDFAQEDLLQKFQKRGSLSQQNRVIKFCTDAGFLTTVDVGQNFMTKDTHEAADAVSAYTQVKMEDVLKFLKIPARDLSDSWTGFAQFTLSHEKPLHGYMWCERD